MLLWRERCRDIYEAWQLKYGFAEAWQYARCVPPKCIRGRWGAISNCQKYLLAAPPNHVTQILFDVLHKIAEGAGEEDDAQGKGKQKGKRKSAARPKAAASAPGGAEDPNYEESTEYSKKLGKWAKDVIKAIKDPKWWAMVRLTKKVREPLDHFIHYLMKKAKPDMPVQPIARLIWYKSKQILDELEQTCDNEQWEEWINPELVDPSLVDQCRSIAFTLATRNQADYHIRIHQNICTDPCQLLWFAKQPADTECNGRRELCQRLVRTDDSKLHITAKKIKMLFGPDICQGARDGTISQPLYAALRLVCMKWRVDVQEIEGINNIIQVIASRAPRISLPLLDARVAIRKMLGARFLQAS